MTSRKISVPTEGYSVSPPVAHRADILLVGLTREEARTVPSRLFGALASGMVELSFDELTHDRLSKAMVVLSPVVGNGFDAIDLAERLAKTGFGGRYITFASEVGYPNLIRNEVESVAPKVAFDIVTMGYGPRLAVEPASPA